MKIRMNKINVSVYADGAGNSRLMQQCRQTPLSRLKQLTFQSFFVSLFRRLYKISNEETNNKSNSQRYAQPIGHLDEKIARQADSENGLGYISKKFREEFSLGPPSPRLRRDFSEALAKENFIKNCHKRKRTTMSEICQTGR